MKTHTEMREELLARAAKDGEFRNQLVNNPKAAVQDALGIELPDGLSVQVLEDSATTAHLVLPPTASLSDADLAEVAGGHDDKNLYGVPYGHNHEG